MTPQGFGKTPQDSSYDTIIAGRVIMDASTAWFLTDNPDFNGSVLVVERDEGYRDALRSSTGGGNRANRAWNTSRRGRGPARRRARC